MAELVVEREFSFSLPAGTSIYRLRRPDVSQDALRRVAARFGLRASSESGTVTIDARGVAYAEPSGWELRLFARSGGWRYRHAARWQADAGGISLEIDDEEASRLALDAIGRYALPSGPELERVQIQRLHVAHSERGGRNHEERIVGLRGLFRRVLDGLPAEGPGGRTIVYCDGARELTGIDHLWRAIDSVYEPVRRLRPVEEALDEVRRRYGAGDGRAEVVDIRLGYFELGWDEEQDYLQPAYVVSVQLVSPDPRVRMNAVVPVAAAVNAVGPIEPPLRARAPQARRAG